MIAHRRFSVTFSVTVSLCAFGLFLVNTIGAHPDDLCHIVFNDDLDAEKTSETVQFCLDQYPIRTLNDSERTKAAIEEIIKIDEENANNCALKCINENLNVTTAEGRIDIPKLLEQYRNSNATKGYALKLTSLLAACGQQTEDKLTAAGDFENNLCKYHVMTMQCYTHAYIASRAEINKLCMQKERNE